MENLTEFCEHLHQMRLRFQKWDNCEKTVAIYYLMVGLPFPNARLLQHALENCLSEVLSQETLTIEKNANDPAFIINIMNEKPHVLLPLIISYLPLLQPGNKEAVETYTKAINKILSEIFSVPQKTFNECMELMSYVFIHPAFEKDQKRAFKNLLAQVLQRNETYTHSPVNESSDESVSPHPENTTTMVNTKMNNNNNNGNAPVNVLSNPQDFLRLNRRSNSLTPGQTSSHESLTPPLQDLTSSQENLTAVSKPRSYSLSSDQALPMSLTTSLQASSSETRLQDLQTRNNLPAMKSVVSWLKSLRLHKYSWVFNNLSYEQMLSLTEESLQAIGITKGARHKILLSIVKLKERSQMLSELEIEVMNGGDLLTALKKLKGVLQSPLQITSGEDLPSQFVKVMGKVCTQLLMLRQPNDECLVLFSTLCEKADSSECFTEDQKRRLSLWRGQLGRANNVQSYSNNHRHHPTNSYRHPSSQSQFISQGVSASSRNNNKVYSQKSSSYPNMQNNGAIGGHRHSIGTITFNNVWKSPADNYNLLKPENQPGYGFNQTSSHHVRFKENSSENDENKTTTTKKNNSKCADIESSLESLCLQMMEHALGP